MKSLSPVGQTAKTVALWVILLLILAACVVGIGSANIRYARANPGGTDFLVAWEGMRSVMSGENPYTDATALRIQIRAYGRPAQPGENQLRVPYPIYSLLFLAPFYWISDFSAARGIWMAVVECATVAFALLSLRLAGKSWKRWQRITWIVFSLIWYLGLRAIINGNVVIFVSLFFCLAIVFLDNGWDAAAGIALACATMKPQVAIFPIACFLIWALCARRFRALAAFFTTMAAFVAVGLLLSPSWISDDLREVMQYPAYNPPGNPESSLRAIFGVPGSWIGIAISIGTLALMLFLWIRLRKADFHGFVYLIALTLVLAPLSGLQTDAGNEYILLLPVAVLLVPIGIGRLASGIRFIVLLAAMLVGLWGLFIATIKWSDQPVQHPIMLFPLPVFLLLVAGADWFRKRLRPAVGAG